MRYYGHLPDRQDGRDLPLARLQLHRPVLPSSIDYRSAITEILDQGAIGSCTANAIPQAIRLANALRGISLSPRARLWLYWQERWIEHTLDHDAGAMPRDGLRVAWKVGIPPETDWPYDISQFTVHPPEDLAAAVPGKIKGFHRCESVLDVKLALVAKYPVVMGFRVPQSFESDATARTGIMSMPATGEPFVGGHCTYIAGYADGGELSGVPDLSFIVLNSWSKAWGANGCFFMPYDFADPAWGLVSDLWAILP